VLDDKTKDSVKITVIATGFRDSDRTRRKHENAHNSFTGSRLDDFADEVDMEPAPRPMIMEEPVPQPAPAPSPVGDVVSVETMRNAMIANFEQ